MSAIAGWAAASTSATTQALGARHVEELLARMPVRGNDRRDVCPADRAALGVLRHAWEDEAVPGGPGMVARSGDLTLVADATLFDIAGLRDQLGRVGKSPLATDVATLLLVAYEAWGPAFIQRLNGDFAFVLWNGQRQELLVGRDFVGRRSLFTRTMPNGEVAVASLANALATGIAPAAELNHAFIAAAVAGLLSGSRESAFLGIDPVPAGSVLSWRHGRGWRVESAWKAPTFVTHAKGDFREGAEELRRLLAISVTERCTAPHVAIYLSGGADSPAVFGAAAAARERGTVQSAIHPVSVSFPEGDSARENEYIEAISELWGEKPTWIDSESMALFEDEPERAAIRDDPYAHTFEQMNRHLAKAARGLGARVALDGHGGDLLFQVSDVAMAELLFSGDVKNWRRVLRDGGYRAWRDVLRWGVAPSLPNVMWRTVDAFRGRALHRPFEQDLPSWLSQRARTQLKRNGWDHSELKRGLFEGPAAYESRWYLSAPYMARAVSWTHDVAIQAGLELRSPLLDRRIVEFAAGRPLMERVSVKETKRLLREAARGLVPDSVLAPRAYKTGVPRGYLGRQMQRSFELVADRVFGPVSAPRSTILLADLGLIEPSALDVARVHFKTSQEHLTGVLLFLTLEAELWLRSRSGLKRSPS